LFAATIAPALSNFKQFSRVIDGKDTVSVDVFMKCLPQIVANCEIDALLSDASLKPHKAATQWLAKLQKAHKTSGSLVPLELEKNTGSRLLDLASRYSELLLTGAQHVADELWESMFEKERTAIRVFFEVTSLLSDNSSMLRQRADASLGRIGMRLRAIKH
jgi:hypothetical protein